MTIALPAGDGTLRIEAADGDGAAEIVGVQLERAGRRAAGCSSGAGPSGSTRSLDDPEVDQEAARRLGARSGLYVPLVAGAAGRSA